MHGITLLVAQHARRMLLIAHDIPVKRLYTRNIVTTSGSRSRFPKLDISVGFDSSLFCRILAFFAINDVPIEFLGSRLHN